jgi:tetratricopeptide (TPR) repeat protein
MSLFVDVIEPLSDKIKASFIGIIENEKKDQERSIRKVCDVCVRFLDYGELRYDRMEDGIRAIQDKGSPDDSLQILLMAVLHDSLDEDESAVNYFTTLAGTSTAKEIQTELNDFITIGRCLALKQYDMLEDSGNIIIERYSNQDSVTDLISNLYLKIDDEAFNPIFQKLVTRAKEQYPDHMPLYGLNGYINIKARNYSAALESYQKIVESIKSETESRFYNFNMATSWDSVAGCYMKMGDADKTLDSCDIALDFDSKAEEPHKITDAILHKKAEAYIMKSNFDQALAILHDLLKNNPDDEIAQELKKRIS